MKRNHKLSAGILKIVANDLFEPTTLHKQQFPTCSEPGTPFGSERLWTTGDEQANLR